MKKYIKYGKGGLLLIFVLFLFGFSSQRNKIKKITNINLSFEDGDNLFITYETVNKLLIQNYSGLKNQPKENIFLKSIENTLLSHKMVANAEVFLTVNGELNAIIKQKTPIARVNFGGEVYYLDSKGGKMPLSSNYSARVPLIKGADNSKISKKMFQLVTLIYNDDFLKRQIVGVEQTSKKEFLLQSRVGSQTIELGRFVQMDVKIKKLKAFYKKAIKDNTLDKYKIINLMYHNQVVGTKK